MVSGTDDHSPSWHSGCDSCQSRPGRVTSLTGPHMNLSQLDLPKLAGVAGSTVGLVIATAILLSWITARYVPAFDRYRTLCDAYRGHRDVDDRHGSLREQILTYQRRLGHLSWATATLCWALLCAVLSILAAMVSMLMPHEHAAPLTGLAALFGSFVLFGVAVVMVMIEN